MWTKTIYNWRCWIINVSLKLWSLLFRNWISWQMGGYLRRRLLSLVLRDFFWLLAVHKYMHFLFISCRSLWNGLGFESSADLNLISISRSVLLSDSIVCATFVASIYYCRCMFWFFTLLLHIELLFKVFIWRILGVLIFPLNFIHSSFGFIFYFILK